MSKRLRAALIAVISIVVLLCIAGYFYFFQGLTPGRILEHVTIVGTDVGGMTRKEAAAALDEAVSALLASRELEVTVDSHRIAIPANVYQAKLDTDGAVNAAYRLGRRGSYSLRKSQKVTAAGKGIALDLSGYLQLDKDAVFAALQAFETVFDTTLVQSSVVLEGEAPDLSAPIADVAPQNLVITKGTSLYMLNMDGLYDTIEKSLSQLEFQVSYACRVEAPDPVDFDELYAQYASQPEDATLDSENFQITREINGYDFDLEKAKAEFDALPEGAVLTVPFRLTAPAVTYESLYESLFRDTLSTFSAHCASSSNRATNLRVACNTLNGMIIYPGEEFSFSPALGERTPEAGYKPAGTYIGNESVSTYGGGICQVCSCVYYCAVVADMQILERHNHTFNTGYMPIGTDATVFWGGPNMRFRNNSAHPIRIDAKADGGTVTISFMGTDDKDYYIKFENAVTGVKDYKVVEKVMSADNPKGYKDGDVITSPYTGYTAVSYRAKYDKKTDALISREWEANSSYSSRDKEICRIEKPASTEPVETQPAVTQPVISGSITPDDE